MLIPLRGAQPRRVHLRWLRLSIALVAVLIFLWSWLMPVRDYILMFFALSGAICKPPRYCWHLGCILLKMSAISLLTGNAGAGACIIGGLYWPRGTAAGAIAALCTGATTSLLSLTAQITLGTEVFHYNGQQILFGGSCLSVVAYVSASLLSARDPKGERIVRELAAAAAAAGNKSKTVESDGSGAEDDSLLAGSGGGGDSSSAVSKGGAGPPSGGGSGGVRAMCLRAVGLGDDLSSFSCADKGLVLFTLLVGCYEIVAFAVPALLRSAGGPMASEPVSSH